MDLEKLITEGNNKDNKLRIVQELVPGKQISRLEKI